MFFLFNIYLLASNFNHISYISFFILEFLLMHKCYLIEPTPDTETEMRNLNKQSILFVFWLKLHACSLP